jgi:hypothetical protein
MVKVKRFNFSLNETDIMYNISRDTKFTAIEREKREREGEKHACLIFFFLFWRRDSHESAVPLMKGGENDAPGKSRKNIL